MIAVALCLLAIHAAPGDGLQRAIAALRAGDARAAWIAAESEPGELERSQAKVWVRHQAGDLEGALAEAERGARTAPLDPWLAERCAYIAISLGRPRTAERALARLESAAQRAAEPDRARWLSNLRDLRAEAALLEEGARARAAADSRARAVVIALGAACLGALFVLARRA